MKKILFIIPVLAMLAACGKKNVPTDNHQDSTHVDSVSVQDTTIYGRSSEFGMSTFSLITDAGDTLELDRGEGKIFGNLDNQGDRFALTVKDAGTDYASVGVAINLTNVEKFTKDYSVCNGRLILSGDTVEILDLTLDCLKAKGAEKEYNLSTKQ